MLMGSFKGNIFTAELLAVERTSSWMRSNWSACSVVPTPAITIFCMAELLCKRLNENSFYNVQFIQNKVGVVCMWTVVNWS